MSKKLVIKLGLVILLIAIMLTGYGGLCKKDKDKDTASGSSAPVPNAPSNLTANAVSSSQINLTWIDNSNNENGFKIERKTGAGGTYVQIATVGTNVTSSSDIGLTEETTYYYHVRAYNLNGDSLIPTRLLPPHYLMRLHL